MEGKKYIEKIYEEFKFAKFYEERKKLYLNITKNIQYIDNKILVEFYQDILRNKEEFDLKNINDDESTNLIIEIFKQINFNQKTILTFILFNCFYLLIIFFGKKFQYYL